MKKKGNRIWIFFWVIIFIPLFIVNLIPLFFTLLCINSPTCIFFAIALIGLYPYFLAIGIIDLIAILFYIRKKQPLGTVKVISYIALVFPAFYIYMSYIGYQGYKYLGPPIISREEAIKYINDCSVTVLRRDSIEKNISIAIDGKPSRFVANSDFDVLLKSARAVQGLCGYNFRGFGPGTEGFDREYHLIYITTDQAAKLLSSCIVSKVDYMYPADMDSRYPTELHLTGVPTGINLWFYIKNPLEIDVKKDLITETLPIFREAQNKCPNLKIFGAGEL